MARRGSTLLVVVLLFVCVATAGGFGYTVVQLRGERDRLAADLRVQSRRAAMVQKGYREQRTAVEGLRRAKAALERQAITVKQEVDRLTAAQAVLREDDLALGKAVAAAKAKGVALASELAAARRERDQLKTENHQVSQTVGQLKSTGQLLEKKLARESLRLSRCETDNGKLAEISTELLHRYKQKGVFSALVGEEPLTGLKKVEIEALLDAYRDRIEEGKLRSRHGDAVH